MSGSITPQLFFSLVIEAALICATLMLLLQPSPLFTIHSVRLRRVAWMSGLMLLCLTFCWSVILGCVITLTRSFVL